jgi:hypothetical protein
MTKGISGKIIQAIATTTAAVSGLVMLEVIKYLLGYDKTEQYRSSFINLAQPSILWSEPMEAPTIDVAGVKLNSWTKFEFIGTNKLVRDLKKYYDEIFKTNITMIVCGTAIIYADFNEDNSLNESLELAVKQVLETDNIKTKSVSITLATEDESVVIPEIQVLF